MAYVALYRAYRPQRFQDVVGQQHIIKTLQNAIKLNKVAHAYLFCGPRGTGKTTLAKIMAKALNCENGPAIEPCDECEICKGIQKGTISDVVEIDAASNNGADDIRALRDSVKYMPSMGRYRVYIIDEVHMLSNAAFNALLKTLEEPPQHVIFILATTEPYKLPNTILSRCQRFDFQAISIEDILTRLKIVAENENIKMTEEAFQQIATSAEGGMRDALSLFDQTISYSVNEEITLADVLAVSGNVSYLKLLELLECCYEGKGADALGLVDEILKEGKEVPRIVNDLILFLRDVLLFKNNAVLEDRPEFHNDKFMNFCHNVSKPVIYQWLDFLNEASNNMRFSNQKRSYLELSILKLSDVKINEETNLIDRIERLEHTIELLTVNGLKPKEEKPTRVEVNIPTKEEIEQIKKETVETQNVETEPVKSKPTEVQIEEIESIMNTASKVKKQELQALFKRMGEEYSSLFIAQILIAGDIVAVNDNSFIVVLQDLGFCNRLMRYESYVKIIDILEEYNSNIKDYICLPKAVWNKIKADYLSKYSKDTPIVKLKPISIGVLKRVEPSTKNEKEELMEKLTELVDKDKIEILED